MSQNLFQSLSLVRFRWIWRWILLGVLVGVVSGLGAIVFNFLLLRSSQFFLKDLIKIVLPPELMDASLLGVPLPRWMILWIPALGGLFAGLLVFRFAPEAEGHGTDAMIDSFHRRKGIVRGRVPVIKTIASAITIGSGGSAGKEGPIAQIGSGFASVVSSLLKLNERDRRILLLAGASGGISAIFKAPLGAALFSSEVLYRQPEFEFEGIIPSVISSIVSYTVYTLVHGGDTIFHIPPLHPIITPPELLTYGVFGLVCAVVGSLYIRFFYGMRDHFFRKINLPRPLKPALGGVMVGMLAFFLPQVLGGGYEWIQSAMDGNLTTGLMAILVFGKIVATSFTISSGGSGGVFAPSLFIGAMLGGSYANIVSHLFPDLSVNPTAYVLVGMGGFFGGVAKVPLASLIMVAEMTGGYTLIVPLMTVTVISYLLLGDLSLYEKQVSTRVDSPAHLGDFTIDILEHILIKTVLPLSKKVETIPEDMELEAIAKMTAGSRQFNFPVVNRKGELKGILALSEIRKLMLEKGFKGSLKARDIATFPVLTVTSDDSLASALKKMAETEIRELPVVHRDTPHQVVSMLSRKNIIKIYHDQIEKMKNGRGQGFPK